MNTGNTQRSLILGTAGHIDHGKSTLIQALTGTDPDRLAEEKQRGITIQLGFAKLDLPSGRSMGVVDVPGHAAFVRQMVSGATGVDVALLVIAADDGIMPQTTEHLAVLELLGVPTCVVALTKCDAADPEWVEFVSGEIRGFLEGTPYTDAPIVAVSAVKKTGLDDLLAAIDTAAAHAQPLHEEGSVRLPIDRVFTIKGAGTVVTGTLWSGSISSDDPIQVISETGEVIDARVRGVQCHGSDVSSALAGNRVAVNISGVKTGQIHPGDWLVAPNSITPTDRFDATVDYMGVPHSKKPLKSGARVHVAHGTREVTGRVLLMNNRESLNAGQQSYAQIRLDEPLPVSRNDRFVIRSYSPTTVIGGGRVLMAHPKRRSNLSPDEKTLMKALDEDAMNQAVVSVLAITGMPVTANDIAWRCDIDESSATTYLKEAKCPTLTNRGTTFYCDEKARNKWLTTIENALMNFHYANPQATGMSVGALQHACKHYIDDDAFAALVQLAQENGTICVADGEVSHAKAGAGARMTQQKNADALYKILKQAGTTPPLTPELLETTALDKQACGAALAQLCSDGKAERINDQLHFEAGVYESLVNTTRDYLGKQGSATAANLKDAMGLSRKYAIPLLEHFDAVGLTRRVGDARELIG